MLNPAHQVHASQFLLCAGRRGFGTKVPVELKAHVSIYTICIQIYIIYIARNRAGTRAAMMATIPISTFDAAPVKVAGLLDHVAVALSETVAGFPPVGATHPPTEVELPPAYGGRDADHEPDGEEEAEETGTGTTATVVGTTW